MDVDMFLRMKMWSIGTLLSYGLRKQQHKDQLTRVALLLLLSSLCCPLHAQSNNDYTSSNTNVTTIDTKVVISAPLAVFTKSMDIFTTGIPIHPVYIQAPSGLCVWLSIKCKGGAARLSLPDYVANFSWTQTDKSVTWSPAAGTLNATDGTWLVTGLGIKFYQNISVSNDVLTTLAYGKGADNDIAGKATMTITLNWNVTIPDIPDPFLLERSKRIIIWAPSSLTSISTFRATVAAICLVGIFIICCLGCLNTVAVSSLRRFSVALARETRDQQECEQNRVFNPLWMPCAPTQPGYNNIESTANPLMIMQRRRELKIKILRMSTPFSLLDRILRARHVRSSRYAVVRCGCPCVPAALSLRGSSSDDKRSAIRNAASKNPSGCCLGSPSSDDDKSPFSVQPQRQGGSQPGATRAVIPTPAQASLRPAPQTAPMDLQKFPADPGVHLRSQHNRQDAGPQGSRGRNENITVGYVFTQYRLAPSPGRIHTDPNLSPEKHGIVGSENETPNYPTPGKKSPDSVADSEVEEEIVAKSDLEIGDSELRSEAGPNPSEAPSSSFSSRSLAAAERESDSGRTSETCFRSPLSDLYDDVLESCSASTSSNTSPWRSGTDSPSPRMQKKLFTMKQPHVQQSAQKPFFEIGR